MRQRAIEAGAGHWRETHAYAQHQRTRVPTHRHWTAWRWTQHQQQQQHQQQHQQHQQRQQHQQHQQQQRNVVLEVVEAQTVCAH